MKILVFSDSHGSFKNISSAIERHEPNIDAVIHLGDGTDEVNIIRGLYPKYVYSCVSGNYEDFSPSFLHKRNDAPPHELLLDFEGKIFFLTHGHKYDVKFGYQKLLMKAEEKNADVVLFGHTHIPENLSLPSNCYSQNGKLITLFNPGSVSFGNPSYGVVHVDRGVVVASHGKP